MLEITAGRLASWTKGELVGGFLNAKIAGVSIDTRVLSPGDLFVPLAGTLSDGHDFIERAVAAGAAGFLTERLNGQSGRAVSSGAFALKVEDTLAALQTIASGYRAALGARVVGITGSVGKTTARAMTTAILKRRFAVTASEKNFNNEVGVPLTLLGAEKATEVIVVEMAMRGVGQIKELAGLARPEIGLITGIGRTHLELLGSVEAIARTKAELIEALPSSGTAILNADDQWTPELEKMTSAQTITFGLSDRAGVRAVDVSVDTSGRASFTVMVEGAGARVRLPVPGRHNVYNALGAAAVAIALGIGVDDIAAGLSELDLPGMRMEVVTAGAGITVINDAYNANPESVRAGIGALAEIQADGRRIAVLGDMLELGPVADESHRSIGGEVVAQKIDLLVTVGELGKLIAQGALEAGFDSNNVAVFDEAEEAGRFLARTVEPADIVLVKASRGMKLEKIIEIIEQG